MDISSELRNGLLERGADLVGFGNLEDLPSGVRQGLPTGVAVAVGYPEDVIRGIGDLPTREYYEQYHLLNEKLDSLVEWGEGFLREKGFAAVAQTTAYVRRFETDYGSLLPHKTVATHAGIGWIGKCALLVTEELGSMMRISSLLTDASLRTSLPVTRSRCGDCTECTLACPAGAVSGRLWEAGMKRESFFDADACRKTARERAMKGFGVDITKCGKCIEVCPYTRRRLGEETEM